MLFTCAPPFFIFAPPLFVMDYLCISLRTPDVCQPRTLYLFSTCLLLLIAPHFSQFTPLLLDSLHFLLLLVAPPPFNKHTSFISCTSHYSCTLTFCFFHFYPFY